MEQLRNLGDERQMAVCVYCGGYTETRDHVPSRVFLDKPYPFNLPVIPACQSCNESFSVDEEYVACLVECAAVGSVHHDDIQRDKIKRILQRKPALTSRLSHARMVTESGIQFSLEEDRIRNVMLKLGRGHAAFELNEPQFDKPSSLTFGPLACMTPENREEFETPPPLSLLPEVGSRAMQRLVIGDTASLLWRVVQPDRYRYLTTVNGGVVVRVVMSEYLGGEVVWAWT